MSSNTLNSQTLTKSEAIYFLNILKSSYEDNVRKTKEDLEDSYYRDFSKFVRSRFFFLKWLLKNTTKKDFLETMSPDVKAEISVRSALINLKQRVFMETIEKAIESIEGDTIVLSLSEFYVLEGYLKDGSVRED